MKNLLFRSMFFQVMVLLLVCNGYAGNVGTVDILDAAITTPKIADFAVTTPKIADGAVTDAKISGQISASKISSAGLDADTVDGLNAVDFSLTTHSHLDLAQAIHDHSAEDIVGVIGAEKIKTYSGVKIVHKGPSNNVDVFNEINAAINSINDNDSTKRYAVLIMPGVYDAPMSSALEIPSYIDLIGFSKTNTIIRLLDNYSEIYMYSNTNISNLTIQQLGIYIAIEVDAQSYVNISNCDIQIMTGGGSGISVNDSTNVTIENIKIHKSKELTSSPSASISISFRDANLPYDPETISVNNILVTGSGTTFYTADDRSNGIIKPITINNLNIFVTSNSPYYTHSFQNTYSGVFIANSNINNKILTSKVNAVTPSLNILNTNVSEILSQESNVTITNSSVVSIESQSNSDVKAGGSKIGSVVGPIKTIYCFNNNYDPI